MTAEEVIRKDKYKDLKNLVLICEAMDEYSGQQNKELLKEVDKCSDTLQEVAKERDELELTNAHLENEIGRAIVMTDGLEDLKSRLMKLLNKKP